MVSVVPHTGADLIGQQFFSVDLIFRLEGQYVMVVIAQYNQASGEKWGGFRCLDIMFCYSTADWKHCWDFFFQTKVDFVLCLLLVAPLLSFAFVPSRQE